MAYLSLQVYDYSKISRLVDLYKTFFLSPPPRNRVVSRLGTIKSSRFCERISYPVIGSSIRVHLEQTFFTTLPHLTNHFPDTRFEFILLDSMSRLVFSQICSFLLDSNLEFLNLRSQFRYKDFIALK